MPITLKNLTDEIDRQRRARPDRKIEYRTEDVIGMNAHVYLVLTRRLEPGMDPRDARETKIISERRASPGQQFTFDDREVYKAFDIMKIEGSRDFTREHPRPWKSGEIPNRDHGDHGQHHPPGEHGE